MLDSEKKIGGIEAVGDDELDAVAGGASFQKCERGQYEAEFPENDCKGCRYLICTEQHDGAFFIRCIHFNRSEVKFFNSWGFEETQFSWGL